MIELDDFQKGKLSVEMTKFTSFTSAILKIADEVGADRDEFYMKTLMTMQAIAEIRSLEFFDYDSPMPIIDEKNRKVILPPEG